MKSFFTALLISLLSFVSLAKAGVVDTTPLSLDLNTSVSNSYFFRGVGSVQDSVVVTPSLDATYTLFSGNDGYVNSLGLQGTTWGVFTSANQNVESSTEYWYEASVKGGINADVYNKLFNVAINYAVYTSPNDSFKTVNEVSTTLTFNDGSFWPASIEQQLPKFTGFRPYVTYAYELEGTRGVNQGQYLELGVTPGVTVYNNVGFNFPVKVGVGLSDYYGDGAQLGYVGFGPQVVVPIANDIYFTGGAEAIYRSSELKAIDNGSDWEFVGKVGISFKL